MPLIAEEILDFWFGSVEAGAVRDFWFKKSSETDLLIRQKFGAVVDAALDGKFEDWPDTPRGSLALIIVLDQLTRNIYRDSARAFAGDDRALAIARSLVDSGADLGLGTLERWFAYMPFEHSEALADQQRSVLLFELLAAAGQSEPLAWAIKHRDVIERFGRFPHRNEILGRASTPDEVAFMKLPGSRF